LGSKTPTGYLERSVANPAVIDSTLQGRSDDKVNLDGKSFFEAR
jgi:hypothetical protein